MYFFFNIRIIYNMNKKIPKVFVNNIKKIDNNKIVFYSLNDKEEVEEYPSKIEINNKINNLFKSNDFIYKKKINIKTKNYNKDFIIISKNSNYLLTLEGNRIYFDDILDIK